MSWPLVALSDFCRTGSGGTPSRRKNGEYFGGSIPWVKSGELQDDVLAATDEHITDAALRESSAKMVPTGAVLIAMYGATVGRTALLEINASTNQAVCFVVPEPGLAVARYVWYALRASYDDLLAKRVGGAQPNISQQIIRRLKVPLPSPSEQRRIVEILGQADALRKLRRDADAKAARILPALFLKMFGDPATNPLDWPTGTLGSFGVKARYGLGQPPKTAADGLPLIRATNINAGHISTKNLVYVDPAAVPRTRNALLDANEVIVVRSGAYTGDAAQVTEDWKGSVVGYDLVATPPDGWTGEFLEQFLLTPFVQRGYFASQRTRAGQPHLNSTQLEATPAFAPNPATQLAFAKAAQQTRATRRALSDAASGLETLFGVMLQRAFSGQLTAKWRQAHMQELLVEMQEQARLLGLPMPEDTPA